MKNEEDLKLKELLNGNALNSKVSTNSSGFGFGLTISSILVSIIKGYDSNKR